MGIAWEAQYAEYKIFLPSRSRMLLVYSALYGVTKTNCRPRVPHGIHSTAALCESVRRPDGPGVQIQEPAAAGFRCEATAASFRKCQRVAAWLGLFN